LINIQKKIDRESVTQRKDVPRPLIFDKNISPEMMIK
jgi:hypothetical protein